MMGAAIPLTFYIVYRPRNHAAARVRRVWLESSYYSLAEVFRNPNSSNLIAGNPPFREARANAKYVL